MMWSMIGWSHHRTPIELREKIAFSQDQVQAALRSFAEHFPATESVLLNTCNRVELYCASAKHQNLPTAESVGQFIADFHGFSFPDVSQHATILHGDETLKHLFCVASSLDSMIVGEAQILSQVKAAYDLAVRSETAAGLMHRAFQRAANVAKRVASETSIHKRRVSVPSVAVSEIATEFFERFDDKRILLIGAGEMGTETLRYLIDAGAKKIKIVNRSRERADELAQSFEASVVDWSELSNELIGADLIVSTTAAKEPIVTYEQFKAISSKRSRAVLILDLAVPRDFDPQISKFSDVYLYAVDDLQRVCDRNMEARKKEWPKALDIVEQETKKFLSESIVQGSGPTIRKLREQAHQVKAEELERLLTKLQNLGVNDQACKEVEKTLDRVVNKILHPPLQSLREHADASNHATLVDALRRLFQIKE